MTPLALIHRAEPSMKTSLPPAGKVDPESLWAGISAIAAQLPALVRATKSAASIQLGLEVVVLTGLAAV